MHGDLQVFFLGVNFVISKTFQKFNKISLNYTREKKPIFFPIFSPKKFQKRLALLVSNGVAFFNFVRPIGLAIIHTRT
jgi:hypothetical protein